MDETKKTHQIASDDRHPFANHESILVDEAVEYVGSFEKPIRIVDATLGQGGHSLAFLKTNQVERLVGIDQDPESISFSQKRLKEFENHIDLIHGNFSQIKEIAQGNGFIGNADIIFADLGWHSGQFADPRRGFSFQLDGPLDMRLNPESDSITAAEILNSFSQEEIASILQEYGEEKKGWRIAGEIVARRKKMPLVSTTDLASLVEGVNPRKGKGIHPATKTFQALRIFVNRELEVLQTFLEDSINVLSPEGLLMVITFHSLEDRLVKQAFKKFEQFDKGVIIHKKGIIPSEQEVKRNPRSRSARMRIFQKKP